MLSREFSEINFNFLFRLKDLIWISLFKALLLLSQLSRYTSFRGARPLVYLAPWPALCWVMRRARSLVMPVYKV